MNKQIFKLSEIRSEDKPLVSSFIAANWGSPLSVSRGRIFIASNLPGFICKDKGKIIGLVTYNISERDCEIVTLDSKINNVGLGSELVNRVIEKARMEKCRKVWLITTNDNTAAIRFYQKRGFEWVGFHKNAMIESRKLKPEIPDLGNDGIPVRHEIEFEYRLTKTS